MPTLYLHNTLTRQKEVFNPIDPNRIGMYVCGPTVYDFAHLGNARPVVVFDVLYRVLKKLYPHVLYVRNITDIDDKIIARSKETDEPFTDITNRTAQAYHEDIAALNALPPDIEPWCTKHIPDMLAMIQVLLDKGHAYLAEGHVLFHVPSMENYGALSRRSRDEQIAGARVEVAPYKKDPSDFVLWKPSAPDQPGWDSPWGRGRPGWHLECSAMSKKYLGVTFDIHGGGLDLIFPHHENEIAQSSCAHDGAPLANYWVHNGFLTINNDKMSKSLKNFFTIRELLAVAPGEALRLTLMSSHYRQPLDFSIDTLRKAKATLDKWYGALRNTSAVPTQTADIPEALLEALCDDLNTPQAIALVHEYVNDLNRAQTPDEQAPLRARLLAAGTFLGFFEQEPEAWFRWKPTGEQEGPSDSEIEALIAKRLEAKKAKNYAESDRIRDQLAAQGVLLEDGPQGTSWKRG
ncbi:MAG: cysteine--tRNA ligase [Alphaproteobacteria bacterium]|nr:cysteine--tRNA ligase [Alphaproteobacteria bacterium]